MATPQTAERMTADEFEVAFGESEREDRATPDGIPDLELVDGVVVEGEMPNRRHQYVLTWLHHHVHPWACAKGGGSWINAEMRLSPCDVREPDLIAWWSGQDVPLDGQMRAVPDLVVEVISPRPRDVRRDREEKLAEYCAHKIPWYWIVEPIHRTFEEYHRRRRGQTWLYDRAQLSCFGRVRTLMERGPTLDLDALWASVEQ